MYVEKKRVVEDLKEERSRKESPFLEKQETTVNLLSFLGVAGGAVCIKVKC